MALQTSGPISMNQIHLELAANNETTLSLNDTDVRALAQKSSGVISLLDFYGKSSWTPLTGAMDHAVVSGGGTIYYNSDMRGYSRDYFTYGTSIETLVTLGSTSKTVRSVNATLNTSTGAYGFYLSFIGGGSNSGWSYIKVVREDTDQEITLYRTDSTYQGSSSYHSHSWPGITTSHFPMTNDGTTNVVGFFS